MTYFSFIPFELSEFILSFLFVNDFNSFINSNILSDSINWTTVYNLHFISNETHVSYSRYLKDISIEKIKFVFKLTDSIEEINSLQTLSLNNNKIKEIPAPSGSKETCLRKEIGLVVLDADQQGIAGRRRLREPVLLAMQRVGGEQHAGEAQFSHQLRHGRNLVRRPGQLLMGQDQGGVGGEGAEHVDRLAVTQVVETAAQRLAVKRDRA